MKVQVARIGKPHGIRGEVTVQLFTDDPESRCAPGSVLQVEAASREAARLAPGGVLEVSSARWNKSVLVLGFAAVADRSAAELLRGSTLWVEAEQQAQADDDTWYEHELLELAVVVAAELQAAREADREPAAIGRVTGLRTLPAQDLLEIELADDGREALIPFVEEIVLAVDLEAGRIVIEPPPGLLSLGAQQESGEDGAERARETGEPADLAGASATVAHAVESDGDSDDDQGDEGDDRAHDAGAARP